MPSAATVTGQVAVAKGHVDMGPRIVDGQWRIQLRDDTGATPVWRNLEDVVIHATDASRLTVPQGADAEVLGPPGSDIWLLPQTQQSDIVWPGWNTQDASVTGGTTGGVRWSLNSVEGPGELALFLTGSFGATTVLFDTDEPLPQELVIDPNTHAHGNWAFTEPGVYRLGITMTGRSTSGTTLTDTRTLTFAVGAIDPASAFPTATTSTTSTSSTTTSSPTSSSTATSASTTTRTRSTGPTSTIADTGANIVVPSMLGSVLLAAGGAAVLAARRPAAIGNASRSRR